MEELFSYAEGSLRVGTDSVNEAAEAGRKEMDALEEKEKFLIENNVIVRQNSAEDNHLRFFQTNEKTRDVSRNAAVGLVIAAELSDK